MTLEKMGFVLEKSNDHIVIYIRLTRFGFTRRIIYNLDYSYIELYDIDILDIVLLEAIYKKGKELFKK